MKKINNFKKAFTLVELLVVITIIAILWVVAYTSFDWATDKAKATAKTQNVLTITKSLSMYKSEKWFFPRPADKSASNIWWYDTTNPQAGKLCTTWLTSDPDWKITWTINGACWWTVFTWALEIWAKWTLWYSWDIKKYLKQDAYDNEIWDLEFNWAKLIDSWIWRFPYAIYANWINNNDKSWTEYNIAYSIKDKDWKEVTKILWGFNEITCTWCPNFLIWSNTSWFLNDWDKAPNIPYKLNF